MERIRKKYEREKITILQGTNKMFLSCAVILRTRTKAW